MKNYFYLWRAGGFLRVLFYLFILSSFSTAYAQLSGVKTINPSGSGVNNYTNFTQAVSDLVAQGVNGPVVFNVSSGTYTEQLVIPNIVGASSTNTITFQSDANDSTAVNLRFNTPSTANYVVMLRNADNIIFRKMSVQSTNPNYFYSVAFNIETSSTTEDCENIQILNCRLTSYWFVTDGNAVVRAVGKSTGLKVKNNAIGNTYGIYIVGQNSVPNYTTGIEIDSNVFATGVNPGNGNVQEVFEPIYVQYTRGAKVRYNRFTKTGCCADDLIQFYNSEAFEISYNRADMSGGDYCITLQNCNLNDTNYARIYNNYFHYSYSGNPATLLRIINSRYLKIMHNNLHHDAAANNLRGIHINNSVTGSNIQIVNNIISVPNGIPIMIDRTASVSELDHNVYYAPNSPTIASINGIGYDNLANIKDKVYTGSDKNSMVTNPMYVANNNLDSRASCLKGKDVGIAMDIYGTTRVSPPTIGANQPTISNDDIGVEAILAPSFPMSSGSQDIKVRIRNFGGNSVTAAQIAYSVNGGTPVAISLPATLGSCDTMTISFTGSNQFNFPGGRNSLKVFTYDPNGVTDANKANDTISFLVCTPLSGNYTIDRAGSGPNNFASFALAVDQLNCGGVSGPVTFTVAADTFTEQFTINKLNGISSTNKVIFIGNDSTRSIIQFAGANANRYTVRLGTGAKHIHFRKLNIKALTSNNGIGIGFAMGADSNSVENCIIDATNTTGQNAACIAFSTDGNTVNTGAQSNYNRIYNNILNNGYYGISIYNNAINANSSKGNVISRNVFNNTYYYGIYSGGGDAIITDNIINMSLGNANNYGMYLYQFYVMDVQRNTIRANYNGIYFTTYTTSPSRNNLINNLVYLTNSTNANSACFSLAAFNTNVYHNTLVHTGTAGAAIRFVYFTTGNVGYRLANNIIYATNGAYAAHLNMYQNANAGITSWDWDNIYSSTSNYVYYTESGTGTNTFYANLAQLKVGYPAWFANSRSSVVGFAGGNDYHLSPSFDAPTGSSTLGITTDVDGETRCSFAPSLGADESKFKLPLPVPYFAVPDTVYVSSPTKFINTTNADFSKLKFSWYIDNAYTDNQPDLQFGFFSTGNYDVKMLIESCNSKDSVTKTISVVTPTSTPVSDFTSDYQTVPLFGSIVLYDKSKYGPTQWNWSVSPASGAVVISETDQNPEVFFTEPGYYTVCLSTGNDNGAGADTCKSSYIFVGDEVTMCDGLANGATSNRLKYGNVYDNGGLGGNYANNSKCTFLLDPCATAVTLKFKQFVMADNKDTLKIYDGSSAAGTLLGAYTLGSALPGGATGLKAASGKMFLVFTSDGAGVAAGFNAEWTADIDPNFAPPVADFTFPSTIYINQITKFESTSTGQELGYRWDFNSPNGVPGMDGGDKATDRYSWATAGTYKVALEAYNCVGTDRIEKQVNVIVPPAAPIVGFTADKVKIPVFGEVTFTDTSIYIPYKWKWEISPANAVYFLTADTLREVKARFYAPGFYTVKLTATNTIGTDSVTRTSYIEVFDYCIPAVGNTSSDIGISRVKFVNIDNASAIGATPYSNYTSSVPAAQLTKGGRYPITITRNTTIDNMSRKVWIDWNNDGDFVDADELVAAEAPGKTLSFTASIFTPRTAITGFTRMRIGTSYDGNNNISCGINPVGEFEDYTVQINDDRNAPVITLNGADTVYVEQGYSYVDAGATASDIEDGNLTSSMIINSTVDTANTGTYEVRYRVSDSAANTVEVVRTVIVTPDVTIPVITVIGTDVTITVNTTYVDDGATASDYLNKDLTPFIVTNDNVDETVLGEYFVTYDVKDFAGNSAVQMSRRVRVVDDVAPSLSLNGDDTVRIEVFHPYTEPGFAANDNYDNNLQVNVSPSAVNTSVVGTTTLTYTLSDASQNAAPARTRVVIVHDTTRPQIQLMGLDTVYLDVFSDYNEKGVKESDNYCINATPVADKYPNTNRLGTYTITYTVEDCEGNAAIPVKRAVKVEDNEAPELSLKGLNNVTVERWTAYVDEGVEYEDNYYSDAELLPLLVTSTNVNTLKVGNYEVCYNLSDPSGNIAARKCRNVTVVENTTGIGNMGEGMMKVYPNPSKGMLTVELTGDNETETVISVHDLLGKEIRTVRLAAGIAKAELDLSDLSNGMYLVKMQQGAQAASVKINLIH